PGTKPGIDFVLLAPRHLVSLFNDTDIGFLFLRPPQPASHCNQERNRVSISFFWRHATWSALSTIPISVSCSCGHPNRLVTVTRNETGYRFRSSGATPPGQPFQRYRYRFPVPAATPAG